MCSKVHKIYFVTHRPTGAEQHRFILSLSKISDIKVIKPWFYSAQSIYLASLGRDVKTLLKLATLMLQTLPVRDVIFLDGIDSLVYPYFIKRNNLILEYSTLLSVEMRWLNYARVLCNFAFKVEKSLIQKSLLVICPNELMERYCIKLGAKQTCIMPNYPPRNFKVTVDAETWRKMFNVPPDSKVAIYVAGGRMREIYGMDLLLQSWKIVEKYENKVKLIIIGPVPFNYLQKQITHLNLSGVRPVGKQTNRDIPNWINIADVCLAPRTPGFPSNWYNDKDSTKISEYAALGKPIVAAGYSPSSQYLLVDSTLEALADGVLKAFDGKVRPAEPHFWEENEDRLLRAVKYVLAEK